jgi:phage terminase large subunit-like protein
VTPAIAIAPYALLAEVLADLSPAERAVLPYLHNVFLRPEQKIRDYGWRVLAAIAGRGFGKTHMHGAWINTRVQLGACDGTRKKFSVGLMAPNEHRVRDVQVKGILDTAAPWFMPVEYKEGVLWPNGVRAIPFTPEAPGKPRSENIAISWATEIVDWSPTNRDEAWNNLTTATRMGPYGGQIVVDTTSKPGNSVIASIVENHKRNPVVYPLVRGTMYDNPLLTRLYLAAEFIKYGGGGRLYDEEVMGAIYAEAAGALWTQALLNDIRVDAPPALVNRIVSVDPAYATNKGSDEKGIMVGGIDAKGRVYIQNDRSGHHVAQEWADIAVSECLDGGCSGIVIETNRGNEPLLAWITQTVAMRGKEARILPRHDKNPFPRRTPGVVYVREVHASESKFARAEGPAALGKTKRLFLVGAFPKLELELTTFEPGTAQSPNRYDAFNHLVNELGNVERDTPENREPIARTTHDAILTRLRGLRPSARI